MQNKTLKIYDSVSFDTSKWYTDTDGFMRVPVIIATAGVLDYQYQDDDGAIVEVREAKLPEEILSKHTVFSAEGKPVTNEHPSVMLDSANYSQHSKGVFINPKVIGESIHGELVIHDRELQDSIKSGEKHQISMGFWSNTEFVKGKLNGETYDAAQRDIMVNHIAVVTDGRAGDAVKLKLDSKDILKISKEVNMKVDTLTPDEKKKIDLYEKKKDEDELERIRQLDEGDTPKEEENKDDDKKDPKPEEDKKDQEEEEEKKDADLPEKAVEMISQLKAENEMLKKEADKKDSKYIDSNYIEARDFAMKYVHDEPVDQYASDVNYYKGMVLKAAGLDSKGMSGPELNGAYKASKVMLAKQSRVKVSDSDQTEYKSNMDKAVEESEKNNDVFIGKRMVS